MASFTSVNQSFYKKHVIEKAFQNLLEESIRYECPRLKKFSDTSELNLSSVRADLFTSIKLNQNSMQWRKDLKRKSKMARKLNRSRQESSYQFKMPAVEQMSQISENNFPSTMDQSFLQPFAWKQPTSVSGNKIRHSSKSEFVMPVISNNSPTRKRSSQMQAFSGNAVQMEPPSHRSAEQMKTRSSKHRAVNEAADRIEELPSCRVVLQKCPENVVKDDYKRVMPPVKVKKEKVADTTSNNDYVFDHWIFRSDENNNFFVKGHLRDSPPNVFWSTSEIVKRLNRKTLLTASGKRCVLDGPLMKNALISKGYSQELVEKFSNGFPSTWREILSSKQMMKSAKRKERHKTLKDMENFEKSSKMDTVNLKENVIEARRNDDIDEEVEDEQEEEEEEEDDEDDDDDVEESIAKLERNGVPKSRKTSLIKENYESEKIVENERDYLFGIFSQGALTDVAESSDQCRKPVSYVVKKETVETSKKPLMEESVKEKQMRTRSMTRSLHTNRRSKDLTSKKSDFVEKPISPRKTRTKQNNDSPHPLSSAASTVSTNATNQNKVSPSNNKTKKSPPVKTSKSKKDKKASSNRKKSSPPAESQKEKPAKQTSAEENSNTAGAKKSEQSKKRKQSKEKITKEWTKAEVQKLLIAMTSVPKSDPQFWQKVSRKVGRSHEECANYYCSCDLSNLDWKDSKKKNTKTEEPNQKKKLHVYNVSDSYDDDLFELDNFLGQTKKIRLNQDDQLGTIFADLSVKTSSASEQNFQTPMSKFFLSPVSEQETPASNFSDGGIEIDWDNADRCVNSFKKKQKKGAGRLRLSKKLSELKTEFKPKNLQLGTLVNELNKINDIPTRLDDTGESNQYFSSESEE